MHTLPDTSQWRYADRTDPGIQPPGVYGIWRVYHREDSFRARGTRILVRTWFFDFAQWQADMDNAFWPYYQARAPFGFVSWFGRCVWAAQRKADGVAVLTEN